MVRPLAILSTLIAFNAFALECNLKSQQDLGKEVLEELEREGISCNKQKVHMTFDDGPSPETTPAILRELNSRGVKASFFITTTNLEPSRKNSSINSDLLKEMMRTGHLIANHGHEHNAYDLRMDRNGKILESGFSEDKREREIERSVALLNAATASRFSSQAIKLFRFPYGRGAMPSPQELQSMEEKGVMTFSGHDYSAKLSEYRKRSPALQTLAGNGFSHLGWNHDSNDSSLSASMPSRSVIRNYIVKNIKTLCQARTTQVALFHDIKQVNVSSIPVILDIGSCLGLKFISAEEMNADSKSLERSGTLIRKESIIKGPVDELSALLGKIEEKKSPQLDCPEVKTNECYSEQLKRTYRECEGKESICLGGRWHSRRDPMVLLNCNLSD